MRILTLITLLAASLLTTACLSTGSSNPASRIHPDTPLLPPDLDTLPVYHLPNGTTIR